MRGLEHDLLSSVGEISLVNFFLTLTSFYLLIVGVKQYYCT
jgi:hypothetical protein